MNYNIGDVVLNLTDIEKWPNIYGKGSNFKAADFHSNIIKKVSTVGESNFKLENKKAPKSMQKVVMDNCFNDYIFDKNGKCPELPDIRLYNISTDSDGVQGMIQSYISSKFQNGRFSFPNVHELLEANMEAYMLAFHKY